MAASLRLDDHNPALAERVRYCRRLLNHRALIAGVASAVPVPAAPPRQLDAQHRQQVTARLKPLRKELEQADKRMAQLSQDKAALEAKLAGKLSPVDMADAGKRLKAANDELASLEERWLALSGEIESLETIS